MNMICRNLLPPVELKVRSTEVPGIALVTLRILNTIMPVTRVFTVMDAANPVINTVFGHWQALELVLLFSLKAATSQVARGDKLKSACQIKID